MLLFVKCFIANSLPLLLLSYCSCISGGGQLPATFTMPSTFC
jgi:hypothetical protein